MFIVPHVPLATGLLTGLAIVLAALLTQRRAAERGLDADVVYGTLIVATLGALFGGHALYTATHGGGSAEWLRFWAEQSVFGVIAGGMVLGAMYLGAVRASLVDHADAAVPGVALGYAVARVGCFLNGDDFGALSSFAWGVHYLPGNDVYRAHMAQGWIDVGAATSLPVVPVQLLLAACGFAIFAVVWRARLVRGAAFGSAAAAYGIARLVLEPLRHDYTPVVGPLSLPQLAAAALFAGGVAALIAAAHAARRSSDGVVPTRSMELSRDAAQAVVHS